MNYNYDNDDNDDNVGGNLVSAVGSLQVSTDTGRTAQEFEYCS